MGALDRTTRRIAAAGSLITGALAMYWLIELLRHQVPEVGVHDVRINIASWSILIVAFGVAARRSERSDKSTLAPFIFAPQSAVWASRFVFSWKRHDFGAPGIMSFALTVGLVGVAILVRERWRRGAAQTAAQRR